MFQGFVERGLSNKENQTARFAALLGHQPRTYSSFAEELARDWLRRKLQPVRHMSSSTTRETSSTTSATRHKRRSPLSGRVI
jgi:hypothetical protein